VEPSTEENDKKSVKISRQQARLIWEGEALRLQKFDPGSSSIFIAGREVEDIGLEDGMMIDIAGVLTLQVSLFWNERARDESTYSSPMSLGEFKTATDETLIKEADLVQRGALLAARLQRFDTWKDREEYLLLKREATIGSSRENSIVLYGSLDPCHARIFLLDDQLWLEDLGSRYGSFVNNRRVGRDEFVLLTESSEIRLGDIRFNRL
jgi:predicted component of type VI protein secretion system